MSLFPEGYGLGPGPRHLFQTYICNRCGSVVTSNDLHDKWHARIDPPEVEVEIETDPPATSESGPWQRLADIPEDVEQITDWRGGRWRRRHSNRGERFWEEYVFRYPDNQWVSAHLPDYYAPFTRSTRKFP